LLKEKSGSHVMKIKLEFLRDNDKHWWTCYVANWFSKSMRSILWMMILLWPGF